MLPEQRIYAFRAKHICFPGKGSILPFLCLPLREKTDMKKFDVRAYGLQELAILYFPHSAPRSASHRLRQWMRKAQLGERLREAGYTSGQRLLTPRQVALIVAHLGEP